MIQCKMPVGQTCRVHLHVCTGYAVKNLFNLVPYQNVCTKFNEYGILPPIRQAYPIVCLSEIFLSLSYLKMPIISVYSQ